MARVHDARLGPAGAGFAVRQPQLPAARHGLRQGVKGAQIEDGLGGGAERDRLVPFGEAERHGVGQAFGDLLKRAPEALLETGAPVLGQGFFGHQQREQLALGDLERGESAHLPGVVVTEPGAVVLERQIQPVPHELEIALDGFTADLDPRRQGAGVGIFPGLNRPVDAQHPLQRGTRGRPGFGRCESHGAPSRE